MTSEETTTPDAGWSSPLKDTPGPADEDGMTSAHPAKIVFFATIVLAGSSLLIKEGVGFLVLGLVAALLLTAKSRRDPQ